MKRLLRIFVYLLLGVALLFLLLFKPTHEAPYRAQAYYQTTTARLDSVMHQHTSVTGDTLYTGWAARNITPDQPTKLMGYGWKGNFEQVRDSLWVRTLVFTQDTLSVALISYDLMLAPPAVAQGVQVALIQRGIYPYFTATHTHHGFGEWQQGVAGRLITGGFNQAQVDRLIQRTVASVLEAHQRVQPTTLTYTQVDRTEQVSNRLLRDGPVDSSLRLVYLHQQTGSTAIVGSFAAHATFLSSRSKHLSGDYPAAWVRQLEKRPDVDFALFAAGAVGSHSPVGKGVIENPEAYARQLLKALPTAGDTVEVTSMSFAEVPLTLDEPQLRLFAGWQVRPWLFHWFFGRISSTLTLFRLGSLVWIGTPADFSGMLYPDLQAGEQRLMVTSFNGAYMGYVIPDAYYHLSHRETRENNWFGPHTGSYFTDLINRMLMHSATQPPAGPTKPSMLETVGSN